MVLRAATKQANVCAARTLFVVATAGTRVSDISEAFSNSTLEARLPSLPSRPPPGSPDTSG